MIVKSSMDAVLESIPVTVGAPKPLPKLPLSPAARLAIADALLRGPFLGYQVDDNGDVRPLFGEPMIDAKGYLAIISGGEPLDK